MEYYKKYKAPPKTTEDLAEATIYETQSVRTPLNLKIKTSSRPTTA